MVGLVRSTQLLLLLLCGASALIYLLFYAPNSPSSQPLQGHYSTVWNTSTLVSDDVSSTFQQRQLNDSFGVKGGIGPVYLTSSLATLIETGSAVDTKIVSSKNKKNVIEVTSSVGAPSPPVINSLSSAAAVDSTIHGILASSIYEAGHTDPNPSACPHLGAGLRLLVLVMSAPAHLVARQAIRQTWGHFGMRKDVSIVFMLGATKDDAKLDNDLLAEQKLYGDMIRGRFIDTYNNLTLKTISMLEWVDNYCPKVGFVLKTDDDMFININKLLMFIQKHSNTNLRVIYGRLARKWKPIRNAKSKYYVSPQQYAPSVFPDFTTGPAYLITTSAVHDLYMSSLNHTYLKLEDVFTTGIVAHDTGVKRVHVNEFLNKRIAFNPCNIQKGISIHMVKYSEQFDLWKKLLDGKTKCK